MRLAFRHNIKVFKEVAINQGEESGNVYLDFTNDGFVTGVIVTLKNYTEDKAKYDLLNCDCLDLEKLERRGHFVSAVEY